MACKYFAPSHIIEARDTYILKVSRFSPAPPPILMYVSRASFGVVARWKKCNSLRDLVVLHVNFFVEKA